MQGKEINFSIENVTRRSYCNNVLLKYQISMKFLITKFLKILRCLDFECSAFFCGSLNFFATTVHVLQYIGGVQQTRTISIVTHKRKVPYILYTIIYNNKSV